MGVVKHRVWWHSQDQDVRNFTKFGSQCQAESPKRSLERETPRHIVKLNLQPFERWAIDLIGILPTTPHENRWMITAIDYATGWPLARAVKDAKTEIIAAFVHEEMFRHYGSPRELLSGNGANLLSKIIKHYLRILATKHRNITPYHPRTNGKVENLNGTLGNSLTKYKTNKPTKLWDEYLPQALFATRIRANATSGYSPFYLLYDRHPILPSDDNPARSIEIPNPTEEHEARIANLKNARVTANEKLLKRAIYANKIRDTLLRWRVPIPVGRWVLVRHEGKQKSETKWYGPYKILSYHPLGTYRLASPDGLVLKNVFNGNGLVEANIANEDVKSWSTPAKQAELRRQNKNLEFSTPEVQEIIDADEPLPLPMTS